MAKIEVKKNRKTVQDVAPAVNEISGHTDKLDRPHKISFNITSSQLMKFKMFCITNKVKQQDQAFAVFAEWLNEQDLSI